MFVRRFVCMYVFTYMFVIFVPTCFVSNDLSCSGIREFH